MSGLLKRKPHPGWLAIGFQGDRVDLVHVRREVDRTPTVVLCDSYRTEESQTLALQRLRKSLKLDGYRCTTLLSSPHYQLHHIEAPAVPPEELKAAVRWRVKDLIDYPVEAATVEVLRVPPDPAAPGREVALYAVTARNEAIESSVRPFQESRLALQALDIPDLAQRNVAALFEPPESGVAMLAFYAGEGILTFTCSGELLLSRHIDIPVEDLVREDADGRGERLERVALEVQRSLDNFDYQFPYVAVSRLLVGPLPRDIGLPQFLSSSLAVPVEPADLAQVMELGAAPELQRTEVQAQYFGLIGAALRSEASRAV